MPPSNRIWSLSVLEACLREANPISLQFTKKNLDLKQLPIIIKETGSIGETPKNTLSRVLQQLRDMGLINFVDNKGLYQLVPIQLDLDHLRRGEKMSRGERLLARLLDELNIPYEREKTFKDLRSPKGGYLRFDFYFEIDGRGFAIEFDGGQHREAIEFFGGEKAFKDLQIRDSIKDKYCKDKNIILIRISVLNYAKSKQIVSKAIHGEIKGKPKLRIRLPQKKHTKI